MERNNGQTLLAKPYMSNINWTSGIDQKTGRPLDYDATKEIQLYSGQAAPTLADPTKRMCPGPSGGNNFWPATYSVKTRLIYIPTATPCVVVTQDPGLSNKASDWKGGTYKQVERFESELTVADPFTGEVKKTVHIPYPNYSGALRPPAAWCSPVTPTAPSRPTTTPRSTSSGRSTSGQASTPRR